MAAVPLMLNGLMTDRFEFSGHMILAYTKRRESSMHTASVIAGVSLGS